MKSDLPHIGVFDSGVGGFGILSEIHKFIPSCRAHYIADQKYAPYGGMGKKELIKRCMEITNELLNVGVELVVVACNTATAVAINELRKNFDLPFVGVEPYINAPNRELGIDEKSRLVVLLTPLTAVSKKYLVLKNRLDPCGYIEQYTCRKLAMLVERGFSGGMDDGIVTRMREELFPLKNKGFTHCILGCTHYLLVRDFIEDYLELECISTGPHVAKRTLEIIQGTGIPMNATVQECFEYKSTLSGVWEKIGFDKVATTFGNL
ncbi:MAG: glutamate racemase [Bacteriovoracaceae bacterium]|nr:glutamate racemase [Bacteriovoracaceae bacterium]